MSAAGWHSHVQTFEKPWFTTFLSTTTCSTCLLFLRLGWGTSFGRSVEIPRQSEATSSAFPTSIVRRTAHAISTSRHRSRRSSTTSTGVPGLNNLETPLLDDTNSVSEHQLGDSRGLSNGQKSPKVPYHDTMHPLFWERGAYGNVTINKVIKLIGPAVAGHMALILQGIGLQFTSASINQMVSGSCIAFTALLSVMILKRRLTMLHLIGVTLSMIGVAVVSLSSLLPANETPACEKPQPMWLTIFGIVITLVSQIVQAVQLVLEELMLQDLHLHPFQVLGYEGIIGMLWMALLAGPLLFIIPGMDVGSQENTIDTLLMLWNSPPLTVGTIIYWFTVLGTNLFGVLVSATIGSVFRSVLLTTRTVLVWVVDLLLFYTGLGGGVVGESWGRWSWIEAFGFLFLLAGTIIYALGSQNVEEAVEKAIVCAIEAQLTSHTPPPGSSPRPYGSSSMGMADINQQHLLLNEDGGRPKNDECLAVGTSSIRRVLVRQVSGLSSLMENDEIQLLGNDTPLGVSPDTIEQGASFDTCSGSSPGTTEGHMVVLEGLDTYQHTGSSSYFNPFLPRLPPGNSAEPINDILGTTFDSVDDNPSSYLQSPLIASPGPVGQVGSMSPQLSRISPRRLSVGGDGHPQERTTLLLNNVRAYLEAPGNTDELWHRPRIIGFAPIRDQQQQP